MMESLENGMSNQQEVTIFISIFIHCKSKDCHLIFLYFTNNKNLFEGSVAITRMEMFRAKKCL